MTENVRISDQRLEHWVERGTAAIEGVDAAHGGVNALDAAIALTRKLDTQDVLSGRRSADASHFIPRSLARQSKPVFPLRYQKS